MRKVLAITYSQTGQLSNILKKFTQPLEHSENIEFETLVIQPKVKFPFPWPFFQFFRIFPETVYMKPVELEEIKTQYQDYDLIILSYQVWFLSPSLPIASFLQSEAAQTLLKNTPVVTLIGCRGMWLNAQEKVKKLLKNLNAQLIDNVVLSDQCGSAFSFLATPLWMFTGKKKPLSWVPAAGVSQQDIDACDRFGQAIVKRLEENEQPLTQPMLKGLGAVKINEKLIASERVGNHSFNIWGKLLGKAPPQSLARAAGLCIYITFLATLILTVVPVTALIKKLIAPLTKAKIIKQKNYYAEPSGE